MQWVASVVRRRDKTEESERVQVKSGECQLKLVRPPRDPRGREVPLRGKMMPARLRPL